MKRITFAALLAFAKRNTGQRFPTLARGRPFAVDVIDDRIVCYPESGEPYWLETDTQVPHFNKTNSLRRSGYPKKLFTNSYFVGLVAAMLNGTKPLTRHPRSSTRETSRGLSPMPRQPAKFELREEFIAFLPSHDVRKAGANYETWMNRAVDRLGRSIGPADLASDADIEKLMERLRNIDEPGSGYPLLNNHRDESNLRSTFRKYVEMVEARSSRSQSPSGGALLLKWMDKESRNYTDTLPLKLFAETGQRRGIVHTVNHRDGTEFKAKCDVSVRERKAELDYRAYAAFNERQGVDNGIARLQFADSDRTALESVQWKPKGKETFVSVPFEVPKFIVPPAPPYEAPGAATPKKPHLIRERPGQAKFRRLLKLAYDQRCCVTGCTVSEVLDGAHIDSYRAPGSNNLRNGLLLRRDVHALFDKHLITIEPSTYTIHVAEEVRSETGYTNLHGKILTRPAEASHHPDLGAIERHWNLYQKKRSQQ